MTTEVEKFYVLACALLYPYQKPGEDEEVCLKRLLETLDACREEFLSCARDVAGHVSEPHFRAMAERCARNG